MIAFKKESDTVSKKYSYLTFGILLALIAGIVSDMTVGPKHLQNLANLAAYRHTAAEKEALAAVYHVSFAMDKTPPGNINTYVPQYANVSSEEAQYYAALFGMSGDCSENDEAYSYSDKDGALFIYKNMDRIRYLAQRDLLSQTGKPITSQEASNRAADFVEDKSLLLLYEDANVTDLGNQYEVRFVYRLDNIKSYAFNTIVTVDHYGHILSMDYYNLPYDSINRVKVRSMQDAYYSLPIDLAEKVDLQKCTLVYFYDESIIQPAYLFEGETSDGRHFESFVKAAIYE